MTIERLPVRLSEVPAEHLRWARQTVDIGQDPTFAEEHQRRVGYLPMGARPDAIHVIARSSPWWVSNDLCEVVDVARTSMPVHHLDLNDVPQTHGIAFFGKALSALVDHRQESGVVGAMAWVGSTGGMTISVWALGQADKRFWFELGAVLWPWGTRSDDNQASESTIEDCHRLSCLWALATEPRVTTSTQLPVRPVERRRAARAGWPISPIVTIDLRRPATSSGGSQEGDRSYSHRWIVRGHWRQQPVGPGGTQRRPTYIAPHIKGPGDKPLVVKPTVGVLR